MTNTFEAQIDKFVADTKEKMLNVVKDSIQDVVEEAQKSEKRGGKMRIDTGFLRASGLAKLNEVPSGETERRKRNEGETGVLPEYERSESADYIIPTLAKMKIGDTFYFGWTAKYAEVRELYDAFMDSAITKWQEIVNRNSKGD